MLFSLLLTLNKGGKNIIIEMGWVAHSQNHAFSFCDFTARRGKLPTEKIPKGVSTQKQNICGPYGF